MYTNASVKGAHAGIGINYSSMRRHECYSLPRLKNFRQDNNHAELAAIFVAILRNLDDFEAKLFTNSETCIHLLHQGLQHKRFCVLVACTRWLQEH
jgi:ribonuclease HI